jgi:hypothetical protein
MAALGGARSALATGVVPRPVPADLVERIRAQLDAEEAGGSAAATRQRQTSRRAFVASAAALAAAAAAAGRSVLCQMYPGALAELPTPDEVRMSGPIRFHLYDRGDVTLVFWEEGPVACALAFDGSVAEAFDLAIAKAVA